MQLVASPTELTTAATDAVIALLCGAVIVFLWRFREDDRYKTVLWSCVFGLLGIASFLGAVAHGLDLTDSVRSALWHPLYLSLGLTVALFLVGGIYDLRGRRSARLMMPWLLGLGVASYAVTQMLGGEFIVFLVFEAVAMLSALGIYIFLALSGKMAGATIMSSAVRLNLAAAAVQASNLSFHFIVSFDHNGLFHLVQMVAIVVLERGLRASLRLVHLNGIRT